MSKRSRSFETNAIYAPRIHYERVVYDKLRVLWRQKPLVAAVLGIALAALSVALLLIAPRYTGEAMIQLDFTRNETVAGEKVQSTAAVDAAAQLWRGPHHPLARDRQRGRFGARARQ
jgi:hypothetical protein